MTGKIDIKISKNAMAVTVSILPGGDENITAALLRNELGLRGIVAGIDERMLKEIEERGIYKKVYTVASGEYATRGKAGYYEFLFDKDLKENVPRIREDGTVDYSPVIQMVNEGQLLAVYHHAEEGENGYTVFGAAVAPAPAKELPPLICDNVEQRGDQYYASIKGKISLSGNRLEVKNHLAIDGDIGYYMRTIAFSGDLHVRGDILKDVTVEVEGSLEVDGVIEGAVVSAGKDIVVHQGIHGMDKAVVRAGGSITTNFIEEADVAAEGEVLVDHMINANVTAKRGVYAKGRNGHILGGKVTTEVCDAYRIGNEKGIHTNIYVKCEEPERSEAAMLVVRKGMYEGVNVEINDMKMEGVSGAFGEFHCTDEGITKCRVGEFRYGEKKGEKKQPEIKMEKPLVLVVDDDPIVLKMEYKYLAEEYRVAAVSTPKDALAFLEKARPDLILLDYLMPLMNGGELLEKIRKSPDESIASIPVFFLTSVTDKRVIIECMRLFPQGYLLKPLGKEELLRIVGEFFAKNQIGA